MSRKSRREADIKLTQAICETLQAANQTIQALRDRVKELEAQIYNKQGSKQ